MFKFTELGKRSKSSSDKWQTDSLYKQIKGDWRRQWGAAEVEGQKAPRKVCLYPITGIETKQLSKLHLLLSLISAYKSHHCTSLPITTSQGTESPRQKKHCSNENEGCFRRHQLFLVGTDALDSSTQEVPKWWTNSTRPSLRVDCDD